jgi:hypothetical protein
MSTARGDKGFWLPNAKTHHDHAERHPSEDADSDDGFQAHASRGLFCVTLNHVFLHDGRSFWAGRRLIVIARMDQAKAMPYFHGLAEQCSTSPNGYAKGNGGERCKKARGE